MQYSVPQRSILGPLLFLLYTADFDAIVSKHGLMSHFYADDSQLYLCCHLDQIQQLQVITIECIMDIYSGMKSNRLRLNPAKTKFLWLAKDRISVARNTAPTSLFNDSPFIFGNTIIKPTTIARNLGVMINQDFSMMSHINKLVQSCFICCVRLEWFSDHSLSMLPGS